MEKGGHFVAVGMVIPASAWADLEKRIALIKNDYGLGSTELHARAMYKKYRAQAEIARFDELGHEERRRQVARILDEYGKKLASDEKQEIPGAAKRKKDAQNRRKEIEPFTHLSWDERKECLRETLQEAATWNNAKLGMVAIERPLTRAQAEQIAEGPSIGELAQRTFGTAIQLLWTHLSPQPRKPGRGLFGRRPTRTLDDGCLMIHAKPETANEEGCLMVHDMCEPRREEFCRCLNTLMNTVTPGVLVGPTPLFVDSRLSSLIHVVDVAAYAVAQYLDSGEDDLLHHLDLDVAHHVPQKECSCLFCTCEA